jgi:uncharacterized protein YtpQ (UPF0354 family)
MASIRILKKSVNQTLSLFIDDCYSKREELGEQSANKVEVLVDRAIALFDTLIEMINSKEGDQSSVRFKSVEEKLEEGITALYSELEAL